MYYAKTYKIKWHDTDACGFVRPSRLLEYMQETANLQCRDYGMDLNDLFYQKGLGFLLSRSRIRIDAPLCAYEEIEVRTWCPPSRALSFLRNFQVLRNGSVVAEALTTWGLMDARRKALIKVADFDGEFPSGDPLDEATLPKRVCIGAGTEMPVVGHRRILYSDLDFNRHMNNTRYADMLCDHIPDMEGKYVSSLSLSYLREAAFGDDMTVCRVPSPEKENSYLFRTKNPQGLTRLEAEVGLSPAPLSPAQEEKITIDK